MQPVISVRKLKKHFGKTKAVDGISFNVQKGEIFGFLGPNGAGKTTTIRCLMDFIRPQEGRIEILGQDAHQNAVELKKKIGYLSGQVRLYDHWNGKEHISLVAKLNGNKDIAQKLIKRLDFDTSKKAKTLSSGNRQKLGLIMAFMTEPEVMIFDEPTNALDPL
ncbi:ABC transporter ATP-binding protein, partial [Patescibacteria group bacterium]|nr:ABC transporter ATP-binding protein [Patescibacteria group bacterium]